jgi:hypothetical protein
LCREFLVDVAGYRIILFGETDNLFLGERIGGPPRCGFRFAVLRNKGWSSDASIDEARRNVTSRSEQ